MLMEDKVVIVAGVGPGMGRSIALASAREGADVVLASRTASRLDELAKEVAAGIDLRKLPEPDDVADAVLFLASDLARAVTGQCLDVNSGEHHH